LFCISLFLGAEQIIRFSTAIFFLGTKKVNLVGTWNGLK